MFDDIVVFDNIVFIFRNRGVSFIVNIVRRIDGGIITPSGLFCDIYIYILHANSGGIDFEWLVTWSSMY